jgi:iron complex outermembrane recepter protein
MSKLSRGRGTVSSAVRHALIIGASTSVAALASLPVAAQTTSSNAGDDNTLQEVVVTGSYIPRAQSESANPVEVITSEQLHESGYTSTQQVLSNLTANGQGTLSQGFAGAFASGASGIALRGLNVGATLTLIDGHRTAPYPIGDDGQRSFVDTSNLPFEAIERIDVLKDGASATYGSDAIAGVVNVILKKSFVGAQFTAEGGITNHGDGTSVHLSGIWGVGDLEGDGHNGYITAEYHKQNVIRFDDRPGVLTRTNYTGNGGEDLTLGVPEDAVNGGLARSATGYVTDTDGNIAGFMPGCNATTYAAGQCTFRDTWSQVQPQTWNANVLGRFTQKLGDTWTASVNAGYFESVSQQLAPPSRAFAGGYQGTAVGPDTPPTLLDPLPATTISATNPTFPTGTGLTVANLRNTFVNIGPNTTDTDSRSIRAVFDLSGKVLGFDTSFSAGYTEVQLAIDGYNYVNPLNLQTALDSTTDPFLVGQANTKSVLQFVAPQLHTSDNDKLSFAHLGFARGLFDLPGGPLGVAFGTDWYLRDQFAVAPPGVQAGYYAGPGNGFSNNFTVGTQRVYSGYAEVDLPVLKMLDIDAAVRYDSYNLSGGKASPKVGFKFTPIEQIGIRGTASKGFRAPGPAENGRSGQAFFAGAIADPILCPNTDNITARGNFVGQCTVAVPGLQTTNKDLKPETSKAFTAGLILEPIKNLSFTVDWYSIEIDDQIVSGPPLDAVRGGNLSPIEQYTDDAGSVALVTPPVAPIAYQPATFINANTTKTQGVDVGYQFQWEFGSIGKITSRASWSHTYKYDLTIDGTTFKLAGSHGPFFFTGDTGNPKDRIQWVNSFSHGPFLVTGTMNYISSFSVTDPSAIAFTGSPQDTCIDALVNSGDAAGLAYQTLLSNGTIPANVSCKVGSFITFDLYGKYDVTKHLSVHGSVLNAFNEKFPLDWVTYGNGNGGISPYNASLHEQGAIGVSFNVGATYTF